LIKIITPVFIFLFMGCDIVANLSYNNPLDVEDTEVPALVFSPETAETGVGGTAVFKVYAVQVSGVSGIHAQITYDNSTLGVTNVVPGDFLNDGQLSPMFFTKPANPQTATGTLDIYYFFLGSEVTRDGSGTVAQINFTTKQTTASQTDGVSLIEITSESEFVDPDDIPIPINFLGQGTVEVQ
jgi:hypothetical protein|tara:strand:- start:20 stop:568 length:549 start_codon:yes stop_codon:yes gene_type:complete